MISTDSGKQLVQVVALMLCRGSIIGDPFWVSLLATIICESLPRALPAYCGIAGRSLLLRSAVYHIFSNPASLKLG